jgi:hypothetical protein
MTPAEAESAIGRRGSVTVTAENRALVRKWLSANGFPALFAGGLSMRELALAYNDTTGREVLRLRKKLAEALGAAEDESAEDSSDSDDIAIATDALRHEIAAAESAAMTIKAAESTVASDRIERESREARVEAFKAAAFRDVETLTPVPTPIPVAKATPVARKAEFRLGAIKTNDSMKWDDLLAHLGSTGVIPNTLNRVLLYGPPRTGKSTSACNIFAPAERVTLHKQQPVDDLLGGYCLKDGTTVWSDGPAVRALRFGRALILDEVDQMSPECRFTLHALMDDPAGVTLASGERVEAAPGYVVIGTTNAPPSTLPLPILDRFDMVMHCHTISDGLRAKLGKLGDAAQRSVATMAMWTRPASPNLLLAAAKLHAHGIKADDIARILYPTQPREQADLLILLAMA